MGARAYSTSTPGTTHSHLRVRKMGFGFERDEHAKGVREQIGRGAAGELRLEQLRLYREI